MSDNNDETRKPKIVEDVPIMRAMHMVAPQRETLIRSEPLPTKHAIQPGFQLKPFVKLEPEPLTLTPWEVSKALAIPSYYRLERNHAHVHNATPPEVSDRIAQCLRKESIAATFDNKQVSMLS